ncbi:hypothetical protein [Streptomyces sp. NPDC001876]|uniref:hypothetical protein n=1 Tax=Streptomyces sp. NPDC001876 TaxID=3154402 RepID=UPI003325E75A
MDYGKTLERDISGGALANRSIEGLARRMYEAIAPVVDRIEKGEPTTEVRRLVSTTLSRLPRHRRCPVEARP